MNHDERSEELQVFDEAGELAGTCTRYQAETGIIDGYFAVARVWVVNASSEILCSRRSEFVKAFPGMWQTAFGGHVKAGDTIVQTAALELQEEAGIEVTTDSLSLIRRGIVPGKNIIFESYAAHFEECDMSISLQEEEVVEAAWLSFDEISRRKKNHSDLWREDLSEDDVWRILQWQSELD